MAVQVTPEGLKVGVEDTDTETRIIYRCSRCKLAIRVDFPTVVRREYFTQIRDHTTGVRSQGYRTNTIFRTSEGETHWLPQKDCPRCRRMMGRAAIKGRLNPNVKCSPKCTNAIGPQCDCSCGGQNHGGAWIITGKA